jgi:hypothetical protein
VLNIQTHAMHLVYNCMSDYYFSKFYQDIKEQDWPQISSFTEFCTAPDPIKQECYSVHNLSTVLDNLESTEHYRSTDRHMSLGFKKHNLVFVPVLKCASSYFNQVFTAELSGWEKINLYQQDWNQIRAFGVIMDPYQRRLKGILQILTGLYSTQQLAQLIDQNSALLSMIPWLDTHSMPYNVLYGDLFEKIEWIPMEIGVKHVTDELNKILVHDKIAYPTEFVNQSSQEKLQLYHRLQQVMMTPPHDEFQGAVEFAKDLKVYRKLLAKYSDLLE